MKLLIEAADKNRLYLDKIDGIILPLEDYAVEGSVFFSLDEIKDISNHSDCEIFVKINKNLLNRDIDRIKDILIQLNDLKIKGVFFYDIAILELVRELRLDINLVWNQTYMVNNYKTCDYYYSRGVQYALLGKEITLEEIIEIIKKSSITSMVEVVSKPSIAFSRRKLISNYYKTFHISDGLKLTALEKVSGGQYQLIEDQNGTSFFLDVITNGTGIIKDLYDNHCPYIIMREYGIDCFHDLIVDTMEYIGNGCIDSNYVEKYKKLGDSTNFFFRKTIYRVKK